MKPVVILGAGFHPFAMPRMDLKDKDVWCFNERATNRPITAAFQMHEEWGYLSKGEEYLNWLRNLKVPVYMREHHDEFPTSVAYPFEEVFEMTSHVSQGLGKIEKLKFFTSTAAYAFALAVLKGYPRIDVYGIELELKTEYEKQRPGYTFWVGFAAGKGIPLNIYCGDAIFKKPLYGIIQEEKK
jgi:hypothetical protein